MLHQSTEQQHKTATLHQSSVNEIKLPVQTAALSTPFQNLPFYWNYQKMRKFGITWQNKSAYTCQKGTSADAHQSLRRQQIVCASHQLQLLMPCQSQTHTHGCKKHSEDVQPLKYLLPYLHFFLSLNPTPCFFSVKQKRLFTSAKEGSNQCWIGWNNLKALTQTTFKVTFLNRKCWPALYNCDTS